MSGLNRLFQALFGNGNRSPSMDYSNPFLMWFNIGAALMVLLPLVVALFSSGRREGGDEDGNWWSNLWGNDGDNNNDEDGNNDAEGRSWWERMWGEGDDPDDSGANFPTLFVYLNGLAIFGALVWYGNRVFRRGAFTLPLLTALLVFSNMALLLALVLAAPVRCTYSLNMIVLIVSMIRGKMSGKKERVSVSERLLP